MIHACVAATKIPLSLIEQAIRRFADQQLAMADSRGNLPLHLVAAKKVGNRTNAANVHGVSDNYDNEDTDILNEIFVRYPKASEIVNNDGLLPIDLAIGVGRRWETGLSCLLKANPKGLAENLSRREIPPIHFPTIFSALLSLAAKIPADTNANDTVIFRILRAYPEA